MLGRRAEGIVNAGKFKRGTGPLEGANNAIKVLKRMAYGFRDFEYFPEFPIYLYIAGFRRQFSSPSRSKTSLWRPKISPSQTFPVDEL